VIDRKAEVVTSRGRVEGKKNEDAYSVGVIKLPKGNVSFALVADGHGGAAVSKFVSERFATLFQELWDYQCKEKGDMELTKESFELVARQTLNMFQDGLKEQKHAGKQGTTLAVNFILGAEEGKRRVISLQVGDSRVDVMKASGKVSSFEGPSMRVLVAKEHQVFSKWMESPAFKSDLDVIYHYKKLTRLMEDIPDTSEGKESWKQKALEHLGQLEDLNPDFYNTLGTFCKSLADNDFDSLTLDELRHHLGTLK
jgi:hypothetical protein